MPITKETEMEILFSPQQPIASRQVRLVQDFLVNELHVPVTFKLQIIPATEVTAESTAWSAEQRNPVGSADQIVQSPDQGVQSPDRSVQSPAGSLDQGQTQIQEERQKLDDSTKLPSDVENDQTIGR